MANALDMEAIVAIEKMTVAEFRNVEFDDNDTSWYELIDGEIVKKASPNPRHQEISFELSQQVGAHVKQNKLGKVYYAPIDVFLDGHNSIQPDLLFIPADQLAMVTPDGIEGVPALVVEIVSPTSGYRDRVTKKGVYEAHGVQEYWLVDPLEELIEIFALQNDQYVLLSAASSDEGTLRSIVLPGLAINVVDVLR